YEIVVTPSLVMLTEAEAPLTMVEAMGWAPVALKVICFTPLPPELSVALKETVTFVLFQPAALAAGDCVALVVGGVLSGVVGDNLATNASADPPPKVVWKAPAVVGKLAESVNPDT